MQSNPVTITAPKGLIPYTVKEIRSLGYDICWKSDTAIGILGTFSDTLRLNLWLRTAHHVLYTLKKFNCRDLKSLYRNIYGISWEHIFSEDEYVSVIANVDTPSIRDHRIVNLTCKDAVVDRLLHNKGRRPNSGPEKKGVVLSVFWKNERCTVSLDTSGEPLSKRGYRKIPLSAPMQETLAAGVVYATGYSGNEYFINPMCGSGTIAIEASMIATNTAPGLYRKNFGFKHTLLYKTDDWKNLLQEAKNKKSNVNHTIIATDNRREVIEAAQKNASQTSVYRTIDFQLSDFMNTSVPGGEGIVVFNPEYGIRLGDEHHLIETYRDIGNFMKRKCPGYKGFVFTGNTRLAGKIGLKSRKKYQFKSGKLDCRLYEYDLYNKDTTRA
jgi:23S rRNA G2445 N2-methylase RlmL